jgi:hypothetical protein
MILGVLSVWFVASYNIPCEVPTDFLDVIVIVLAIVFVRRRRRVALLILVAIATLSRESSAYVGVLVMWTAVLEPNPQRTTDLAFGAALVALAVIEMMVVRTMNRLPGAALHNHLMIGQNVRTVGGAILRLGTPTFLQPLAAGGGALIAWLRLRAPYLTARDKALTLTALTIMVPTWLVTSVQEIRVYLPSVLLG